MLAVELDFWIPALALAVDQRDPNASPEGFAAAGLFPAEDVAVADWREEMEDMPCLWPKPPDGA